MCSGHGFCISGVCICKKGWLGLECSEVDPTAKQCLPGCSTHGHIDMKTQLCECDDTDGLDFDKDDGTNGDASLA